MQLNQLIDHTILGQDATREDVKKICDEAREHQFKTVCVHPCWIEYCKELLEGSGVGITTVIGFPLGSTTTETKVFEAKDAIRKGADEIDMVVNVGKLKSKDLDFIKNELLEMREATRGNILKVIIETCLLTKDEIIQVSTLARDAKADFVKTSTGFSTGGATEEDVHLIRETIGNEMGVKASGGIRDYATAEKMIAAGANRIGASKSIEIIQGAEN